jgi:hypothetical protein
MDGNDEYYQLILLFILGRNSIHKKKLIPRSNFSSPTNAILDSFDSIRRYLELPTSCKCGLQCPLIVDKVCSSIKCCSFLIYYFFFVGIQF